MSKPIIAVYPGTFDPVHSGHLDIIKRSHRVFDEVVVSVLRNQEKKPVFSVAERVEMIEEQTARFSNCRADSFDGLLVDYLDKIGATVLVRGLRAVSDFEYEFQMALMNRRLNPRVETVFMVPRGRYIYLSSKLLKEVFFLGGDLEGLAPPEVLERLGRLQAEREAIDTE